jgi:hypothetical protein
MMLMPQQYQEIEERVQARTSRRVRDLAIRVGGEEIVLTGRAGSFHVKQLAQHGVRDVLPDAPLVNAIVVDRDA